MRISLDSRYTQCSFWSEFAVMIDLDNDDSDRKYRAPALEKGLDILEALARNNGPMTASQLAGDLGRSVSELFRMISTLEFRGYIETIGEGRDGYLLTNKLFALGLAQPPVKNLLEVALPIMNQLSQEVGQSCHLVVRSSDQIVVVARCESPRELGFMVRIGYRQRLIETHSGLLLFGLASEHLQENMLEVLNKSASSTEIEVFIRNAKKASDKGFVESPSPFVEGVTDLCVPVMGHVDPVATLIVPYINIRSQRISPAVALNHLHNAAHNIKLALGNNR